MSAKSAEVRERVLSLFESARKAKGAAYEPERFQAFLTDPPRDPNRTWLRGPFVRFMYSVEQEFGFCFTREEWDRTFSFEEFVSRIEQKLGNPKQAHRFACSRFATARSLNQLFLQIFFATAIPAVALMSVRITAVRLLLLALWAGLVAMFVYSWFKDYGHLKKIVERSHDGAR